MKKTVLIIVLLSFGFSQQEWNMEFMRKYVVDDDTLIISPNSRKPYSGRVFSLYDNGRTKEEGKYRNGKQDGLTTHWNENGQKSVEETYKDGKLNGLFTYWQKNGQKWEESTYKDGKKDGLWTWYNEDGTINKVKEY